VPTWSRPPALLFAVFAAVLATNGGALSATTITLPPEFADELVAAVASPTALAFTPDGRILITTQPGQLRVYQNGSLVSPPALDLNNHPTDICTTSERGLLGVEVDPNFTANGYIYLYWSPGTSGSCKNRLSRFTMTGNTVPLASELILVNNIPAPLGTHNAGDVHVAKDGHLYVSVGDGGSDYAGDSGSGTNNDAARDMHALVGKILRVTRDGGIPADNPFQGAGTVRCHQTGTTTAPNKCQEIFATGLRNPFRIAFDPNAAGVKFHINDVGQNHWEEIDLGTSGADYGWNVREGPCVRGSTTNCGPPPAGITNPIFAYQQGSPSGCRAITGGAFVPAGVWPAAYTGSYLFADYVCGRIFKLDRQLDGTYVRTDFAGGLGSDSAVHMRFGPHQATQALYYTTYEAGGSVRRITHTGAGNRVPTAAVSASPTSGPAPLTVDFNGSGSSDPDAGDTLTYLWDFGDGQTTSGSSPTISHTYSTTGAFTASLRVRDNHGATSSADAVQIQPGNTAPSPTIETPASGAHFRVGQNVVLHGSATDPQDGPLSAARLSWRVLRHHGTSHTHPWLPDTTGNDVPISTPSPEDLATTTTSFLEVRLTATDSQGLGTTVTRAFSPSLVDLSFATQPVGLKLELNGEQVTAPFTFSSWEAWSFPVSAQRQQDGSGATWVFDHWSDGGAATHDVTTGTAPAAYTATFRSNAAPVATGSSISTSEDTARTVVLGATDADSDPLSFSITRNPGKGTLGPLTGNTVVYTPQADANGPDSFEFSASDGDAPSAKATVAVTVDSVNDAPVAVGDSIRAATDAPVLVDVLVNDSPGPADEAGQALRLAAVGTPAYGTATAVDGRVLYSPARDHNGPDSFSYIVCDEGGTRGAPDPRCTAGTVDFAFVAFPLPANVAPPRVVGGARAGMVAVAEAGDWDATVRVVEYRWLRCPPPGRAGCTSVAGASDSRYRVALADIGKVLRVLVTVRNRFGATEALSAPTGAIASPVVISAVRHRGDDWVLLENKTSSRVALRGWSLSDAGGSVHRLGRVTIRPLRTLRIDTRNIWSARDRALLRLPNGRLADACAYTARRATARC
jgi:glucose/arabinose dehydrogenase